MTKKYEYKPVFPFKSYEEEANFWDTHSTVREWSPEDIVNELGKNSPKKNLVIHVKVEPFLKTAIERKAKTESRTTSSAIRNVLTEWVRDG